MNRVAALLTFLSLLFAVTPLYGLIEGRIADNKIPSITAEVSLEKSEFLYNAPVYRYINVNFGTMVNRWAQPGLSFGLDFQWLDAEKWAGTIRTNAVLLTNRKMSDIFIGGYLDASITAGEKISGFKGVVHSIITVSPGDDPLIGLELQLGAYVSPHESMNIFLAPAVGRNFIKVEKWYFNLVLALEVFLWK
jgi:hypothetical protein